VYSENYDNDKLTKCLISVQGFVRMLTMLTAGLKADFKNAVEST